MYCFAVDSLYYTWLFRMHSLAYTTTAVHINMKQTTASTSYFVR